MAAVDYYDGGYPSALKHMEPALQRNRDNLWAVRLRADIHRRQGQDKEILKDEMQIWDRREDGDYQGYAADFACSAFRRGMFQEAIDRADAYHGASEEQALVQLLSGLPYLAQGDLEAGVERLSAAAESCDNLRILGDIVIELELLRQRASKEGWASPDGHPHLPCPLHRPVC